ncbi:MAG: thioredoxin domain-containing protein, partial [Planctomycetota bacterium]
MNSLPQRLTAALFVALFATVAISQEPAKKKNQLAGETSPYLLQHVYNPVNWHPWNEKTLAKAVKENKPIFLSIGYSSCHWCHVMERESFTDKEIADFLNKHFICIKVDREERPDVDAIYMMAVQMITRRGGWPLSAFLTPDTKPFFGGTYFPARDGDRPGLPGFLTVLKRIHETYQKNSKEVNASATQIAAVLKKEMGSKEMPAIEISVAILDGCQESLAKEFDERWGGFGFSPTNSDIPKFPTTSNLFFLLERAKTGNKDARKMLVTTLDRIAEGGMRDQVGGGFHRYSVDRFWHIPHFEKMLYDNGQLATVYAEAFELTGDKSYERAVNEMMTFLAEEMTDKEGVFYSALDADSEEEEGAFYRWLPSEWESILGKEDAELFRKVYAANPQPNFEKKYFVPLRVATWETLALQQKMEVDELVERLSPIRKKLFDERAKRERPLTDTKIVTGWNGLMIRGMADAGRILKNEEYIARAAKAADFLMANVRDKDGRLYRTFSQGKPRLNAYLDDYAFLANGLLALHRATGDAKWIAASEQVIKKQDELFWDAEQGGYFFTSSDHEKLIVRGKLLQDNARPSGNAVAAENLIYLSKAKSDAALAEKAEKTIRSSANMLNDAPSAVTRMCYAISLL